MPGPSGAAASCGLFFGQHNGALRFASVTQFHRDTIRGVGLEEMQDAFAEEPALEPLVKQVRSQDVVNFFEKISGTGLAFHLYIQFAKTLHPAPDRRARHADFARNASSTDD